MNELNSELLRDLIESTNFKKKSAVRNPINIIWMLQQIANIPEKAKNYLDNLRLKEHQFNYKSSRKTPSFICDILSEESIFIKRFDNLINKIDDLTPFCLSIIDLKSISILDHSIKLGLNINQELSNTYLLKYALDNKIHCIANYLYDLPHIDKFKIDINGNNLAHLAALGKNYYMIYQLSKQNLSLFYVKNNDNKIAIDIIFKYTQYDTLPNKTQSYIKEFILMFIDLHHTNKYLFSNKTFDIINNSIALRGILIESNYHNLNNSLINKSNTLNKTKKIKI